MLMFLIKASCRSPYFFKKSVMCMEGNCSTQTSPFLSQKRKGFRYYRKPFLFKRGCGLKDIPVGYLIYPFLAERGLHFNIIVGVAFHHAVLFSAFPKDLAACATVLGSE